MSHYKLRFRQVHLDFHTSPKIPEIGAKFDRAQWQEALRTGHVNSITCFSKCHHGWSYHPTSVGKMHPHLGFDLLRAQMDASREIGVNVPVYLSAGLDNAMAEERPDWREITVEGCYGGWNSKITDAAFMKMCFNSPYLDYLCDQIEEAVRLFPEANGIFLDIVSQGECCCKWCLAYMEEHGLDAGSQEDRKVCSAAALDRYYRETTAACRRQSPEMPVFHNSGHVAKDNRGVLKLLQPPGTGVASHRRLGLRSLSDVGQVRPADGYGFPRNDRQIPHHLGRVRRLQAPECPALRVRRDDG